MLNNAIRACKAVITVVIAIHAEAYWTRKAFDLVWPQNRTYTAVKLEERRREKYRLNTFYDHSSLILIHCLLLILVGILPHEFP